MDLGKLAQLGNREKAILAVVILLAFIYGSHLFLIQPQRNDLKAAKELFSNRKKLRDAAQEKSKNLGKLEAEYRELKARLEEVDKKLLTDEEADSLLRELPELVEATENRLLVMKRLARKEVLRRGRRRAGSAKQRMGIRLMRKPVEMNLTGSYGTICNLVSRLKEREPSLTVETINLEADQANLPQLEVNLRINLHIIAEPQRAQTRQSAAQP